MQHDPQVGQLWEADNRLFYIMEVVNRDYLNPACDVYRCLALNDRDILFQGHLTIRRQDTFNSPVDSGIPFHTIWKRLA